MISNSGHDENGKYNGGAAGDQTGKEWQIIPWYSRPWNVVLRHPNAKVREQIATFAEEAAKNNTIGYDMNQRTTFWKQLVKVDYQPSRVTTPCEADCSSGVTAIVKATGYILNIPELKNLPYDLYTGNMRKYFKVAGFEVLTANKYLSSDDWLLRGDILLYEGHHTATNLTTGSKVTGESTQLVGAAKKKANVKKQQEWLNAYYSTLLKNYKLGPIDEDGIFGPATRAAALCVWKDLTNRKQAAHLQPSNRSFGPSCRILASSITIKAGTSGTYPAILKLLLASRGYRISSVAAAYTSEDHKSLIAFMKGAGIYKENSTTDAYPTAWYKLFN